MYTLKMKGGMMSSLEIYQFFLQGKENIFIVFMMGIVIERIVNLQSNKSHRKLVNYHKMGYKNVI